MEILMLNLGIVYVCSLFATMNFKRGTFETDSKNYNTLFIVFALISLIVVSGFRYKVGTDYAQYAEIYTVFAPDAVIAESEDPGFMALCKYLNTISPDPQLMFLVTSVIINTCVVLGLKRYSNKFELSMFLYITTFCYYSTMNGVRQWIAASISFIAYKYLQEKDFKKYASIILLASMIHASAVVMIPIYFIVNRKTFSKENLIIIIIFILATLFYDKFSTIFFGAIGDSKYAHYEQNAGTGVNPIRVAVYILPLLLVIFNYKKINPYEDRKLDTIINLCIISALIWMLSMNNMFLARLTFYFDLYFTLLIPELTSIGRIQTKRFMYFSIACAYFLFSYILLVSGDSWIIPYTFRITLF